MSGSPGKIAAPHFLAAMYSSPWGARLDAISMHVYPDPSVSSAVSFVERVRQVRDQFGAHETPIWITETGVSTTGWGASSEGQQASTLVALDRELGAVSGVEMLLFHTLVEPPRGLLSDETGYGVVSAQGRKKPAYCALAAEWERPDAC